MNGVPGSYALASRPLEAQRTGSALSDGVNAIIVDDVQMTAVVRVDNEALLRYRQLISVGAGCSPVKGHPCAYPTADFRSTQFGEPTGRTSSCQRESTHGGKWYDTDVNMTVSGVHMQRKSLSIARFGLHSKDQTAINAQLSCSLPHAERSATR